MRAKEVVLLVFIILVGIFITQVYKGKFDLDLGWRDSMLFGYEEFVFEETEDIESIAAEELHIRNSHGSIEIFGSDAEENSVSITFKKRIWRKEEAEARKISDLLKMTINTEGQILDIITNRQDFKRRRFDTDFIITVPVGMKVTVINSYGLVRAERVGHTDITNRYGEVLASDIDGELKVSNSYDEVEVTRVESDCRIDASYSGITISHIRGTVDIRNKHGRLAIEDVSGDVIVRTPQSKVYAWDISGAMDIENSYEKIELTNVGPVKIVSDQSPIDIEGAKGTIDIYNRYDKVRLNDILGSVYVEGRNLGVSGDNIHGDEINLVTTYHDIELDNFSGKTSISLSHGDLHLSPAPLLHSIEAKCSHVDIKLFMPENRKYPLEAQAEQGEIQWKLDALFDFQKDNGVSVVKAFTDERDKPSIFLSTTYGTIWIEESIII